MMKKLLFFFMIISYVIVKAQPELLTAKEKATMDSLNNMFSDNRHLDVINVRLKKMYREKGKYYVVVEWKNLGKEFAISFSGTLNLHKGDKNDDGMIWLDSQPLSSPLLPGKVQLQDYELPEDQHPKKFINRPPKNVAFVAFRPQMLATPDKVFIYKHVNTTVLKQLTEQNSDYNTYKELSERKQKNAVGFTKKEKKILRLLIEKYSRNDKR